MDLSRFHPSRRAFIRAILAAGGFASPLLSVIARAQDTPNSPVLPGFQALEGEVRLNGYAAALGQEVRPGDVCTTGVQSSCTIVIGEHVYLLRENSEIEFYAELFEEAEADQSVSGKIRILAGAMLSVFGKTETSIVTPLATIGIRGTACYVDVEQDRTYVCLCYGRADISSSMNGKMLEHLSTTHHDQPRYIYAPGSGDMMERAPVSDHTDAELRMLEALVGRQTLFDKLGIKTDYKRDGLP